MNDARKHLSEFHRLNVFPAFIMEGKLEVLSEAQVKLNIYSLICTAKIAR